MEVLAATWSQFDLHIGVWTKPSSHTKTKKVHRVPLSGPAIQLLGAMKEAAGRSLYLFPSPRGDGHLGDIKKSWASVCQAAGITDAHVHDLRHSFAATLASGGQSLPVIGALLGHTQAQTTQRYSHLVDEALRDATEKAGRVITRQQEKMTIS